MKAVPQLLALSLLAVSSIGVAALAGCSAPTVPSSTLDDGTGTPNTSGTAASTKVPAKSSTSDSSGTSTPATPPATAATTPPAASTTPPPSTTPPATSTDPQACLDQCAATGVAAQYWSCSAVCQNQTCDDNCWNASCGANAQACETALDACDQSCGLPPGGP